MKPWEEGKLTPREIRDLFDGYIWRHSRQIEIVAMQTANIRGMMQETTFEEVLRSFPFYDGELLPKKR